MSSLATIPSASTAIAAVESNLAAISAAQEEKKLEKFLGKFFKFVSNAGAADGRRLVEAIFSGCDVEFVDVTPAINEATEAVEDLKTALVKIATASIFYQEDAADLVLATDMWKRLVEKATLQTAHNMFRVLAAENSTQGGGRDRDSERGIASGAEMFKKIRSMFFRRFTENYYLWADTLLTIGYVEDLADVLGVLAEGNSSLIGVKRARPSTAASSSSSSSSSDESTASTTLSTTAAPWRKGLLRGSYGHEGQYMCAAMALIGKIPNAKELNLQVARAVLEEKQLRIPESAADITDEYIQELRNASPPPRKNKRARLEAPAPVEEETTPLVVAPAPVVEEAPLEAVAPPASSSPPPSSEEEEEEEGQVSIATQDPSV